MLGTNLGLLAISAKMVCRQGGGIVVAEAFVSAWEGQIRRLDCCVSRLGFLPFPSEAVCGWDHTVLIARGSLNNASLAVNSHTLGVQADYNSSFEVKADGYWERSELLPTKRPHLSQGNLYYSVEWGCNSNCTVVMHGSSPGVGKPSALVRAPWPTLFLAIASRQSSSCRSKPFVSWITAWVCEEQLLCSMHCRHSSYQKHLHWIMQERAAGLQTTRYMCVPLYPSEETLFLFYFIF